MIVTDPVPHRMAPAALAERPQQPISRARFWLSHHLCCHVLSALLRTGILGFGVSPRGFLRQMRPRSGGVLEGSTRAEGRVGLRTARGVGVMDWPYPQ